MTWGALQSDRVVTRIRWRSAFPRIALIGVLATSTAAIGVGLATAQPDTAFEASNPAMFVAQDDDTTIYLFGTVHFLPCLPETNPPSCASGITPLTRDAIALSDEVWLETNVLNMTGDPAIYTDHIWLGEGLVLSDFLPQEEIEIIANEIVEQGQAIGADLFPNAETAVAALGDMQPWVISQMLSEIGLLAAGWTVGVDYEIADIALEADVSLLGFETEAEIVSFGPMEPFEHQIAQLRSLAVALAGDVDMALLTLWSLSKVWGYWASGQLEQILVFEAEVLGGVHNAEIASYIGLTDAEYAMVANETEAVFPLEMQRASLEEVNLRLVTQRNLNWMADIKEMLDRPGTFFIAVGAAHLVGEFGLPTLLEGAGATVTRVQ